MAFENGFAANEFELQEKLNAFILSIDGWRKISQTDDFGSVYFSSGEDGYKDIYIRSVAGLTENPAYYGGNQRDFGDGYTGFLNFFVYQFYPEGGDGYDGYGESGKLGPMFFHFRGSQSRDLWMQAVSNQGSGSNDNRRWVYLNDFDKQINGIGVEFGAAPGFELVPVFDGKRKAYTLSSSSVGAKLEWDWAVTRGRSIDRGLDTNSDDGFAYIYYLDPTTRQEYIWHGLDDQIGRYRPDEPDEFSDPIERQYSWSRWVLNKEQGQTYLQAGFQGPPWPEVGNNSYGSSGGHGIWDGHNNIYVLRGRSTISNSLTKDWAKYHISTGTWIVFTDEPLPQNVQSVDYRSPTLPEVIGDQGVHLVWLDKKTTGYQYHRIYSIMPSTTLYYIDIDENSGLPVGSWTSQGSMPISSISSSHWLFHNFRDRFFYQVGSNDRSLYTAKFKESGNLNWTLVDSNYFPGNFSNSQGACTWYVDGYASRVRTSLYDSTEYWFFGDKDHITVAAKADGIFTFCYMGAISPFTNTFPAAKSINPVFPGSNVQIQISDLKGEFVIGQRMYIADVNEGGGGSFTGEVEGIERKFMPIEKFEIIDVDPGVSITADQISYSYTPGARISFDPQPVGITLEGLDKIQMTNSIDTTQDHGALEPVFNICKLQTVRDSIVNASGGDDRTGNYSLWPVIAVNEQSDDTNLVGTESRGSLIGVFAASGTGDLESGDTIAVGSNTFIVLDVTGAQDFKYVFGPIN